MAEPLREPYGNGARWPPTCARNSGVFRMCERGAGSLGDEKSPVEVVCPPEAEAVWLMNALMLTLWNNNILKR